MKLAARIESRPEAARAAGKDFETWAQEGLVDRIIVCNFWPSVDFGLPLEEWNGIALNFSPVNFSPEALIYDLINQFYIISVVAEE